MRVVFVHVLARARAIGRLRKRSRTRPPSFAVATRLFILNVSRATKTWWWQWLRVCLRSSRGQRTSYLANFKGRHKYRTILVSGWFVTKWLSRTYPQPYVPLLASLLWRHRRNSSMQSTCFIPEKSNFLIIGHNWSKRTHPTRPPWATQRPLTARTAFSWFFSLAH